MGKAKKILALALAAAMLFSAAAVPVSADPAPGTPVPGAPVPTISVTVTDTGGTALSALHIGDVVHVRVSLSDFPALSMTVPSIHFNPDVMEVWDATASAPYPSGVYARPDAFFTPGDALSNTGWGGGVSYTDAYPYLNNGTGLIRMLLDNAGTNDLSGTQTAYTVTMRVKGLGDPDLRMSRIRDGLADANDASAGFKPNESDWYDTGLYNRYHDLTNTPIYAIFGGDYETIALKSASLLAEPNAAALITKIRVDTGDPRGRCFIGDTFAMDFYVKNITDLYNITVPFLYDTDAVRLLDVNRGDIPAADMSPDPNGGNPFYDAIKAIVTVPDGLELMQNGPYPTVNTITGFVDVLIKPTGNGKLTMNGDETLLCTLYFKALKEGGFGYRFPAYYDENGNVTGEPIYDETSPAGVMAVGSPAGAAEPGAQPIFPEQALQKLLIEKDKSKAPDDVIVIPQRNPVPDNDPVTADVIVTGAAPGAAIALYYADANGDLRAVLDKNGNPITAKADDDGCALFLDVPIDGIKDAEIWAAATEPNKSESDPVSGRPDDKTAIKVIVGYEPNPVISVTSGTAVTAITFPTTLTARLGYYAEGYTFPFLLPAARNIDLAPNADGWVCGNYAASTAGTYRFTAVPDADEMAAFDVLPIDADFAPHLPLAGYTVAPGLQEVVVGGSITVPSGGGGGTQPVSNLLIQCLHRETDAALYSQTVTKVVIGTTQTVSAPSLDGYVLDDTTPKTIVISSTESKNVVTFYYLDAPENGTGTGTGGWETELLNDKDHFRYLVGYEDGTLRPERAVTREETATVFYRLLKDAYRAEYRTAAHTFNDVAASRWSVIPIATLENAGIVLGYPDGGFKPNEPISRVEFTVIAMRFTRWTGSNAVNFNDISGHWAQDYITAANSLLWVDGYPDGSFKPNNPISRAELAAVVNRVLRRDVDAEGLLDDLIVDWPDLPVSHWAYYDLQEATVSHNYERRTADETAENWTSAAADMDFSADLTPAVPIEPDKPVQPVEPEPKQPIKSDASADAIPPTEPKYTLYTVSSGDTLTALSRRFGVTVAAIQAANGLKSDLIKIGQVLQIPNK
jgi:hypothetical protein